MLGDLQQQKKIFSIKSYVKKKTEEYEAKESRKTPEQRKKEAITQAKEQERQQELSLQDMLCAAGVPKRLKDRKLSSFMVNQSSKMRAIKNSCESFCAKKNQAGFVVLIGNCGTGKTHLSVAIIREFVLKKLSTRYVTAQDIFREIKDTFSTSSKKNSSSLIKSYAEVDLLIIDEIGSHMGTEFEKVSLFEIASKRFDNMLPTVFISNLSMVEFQKYMGLRFIDRIKESRGFIHSFSLESYRRNFCNHSQQVRG